MHEKIANDLKNILYIKLTQTNYLYFAGYF